MPKKSTKPVVKNSERVRIIPLGGLEQIGMNITAFEYGDSIIVVDCGLAFPSDDMLGVDLVVPDVTYLKENYKKIKGLFITHGHEDHIGGIPYVFRELKLPIYATKLTIAMIEDKLDEHGMKEGVKCHTVEYGGTVKAGDFKVEFIRTNHSIADAASLAITSPAGVILHTGDFKVDYTPVYGDQIDLQRLGEIGKKGVLALLADSTNAIRPGFTPSEKMVKETFDSIFSEYHTNRIFIATFASNIYRVQQIVDSAMKVGRKVAIEGRSMVAIVELAQELGYLNIPENQLVDISMLQEYPDEKIAIIMTGSQGEAMAALSRIAAGKHSKITVRSNDVVVFSSSPIPGNEKAVSRVINALSMRGAKIINHATHVSGHACEEELKLIYALTKPQYAVPLHGEYRHREANAEIARRMQVDRENVFLLNSGDVLELSEERGVVLPPVAHGGIMVDGLVVGDVGNMVIRDRQNLSKDGIVIVCVTIDVASRTVVAGPELISRGFVFVRENETLMDDAKFEAEQAIDRVLMSERFERSKLKSGIKEGLSSYFWQLMKRNPVIVPIIMEI